MASTKMDEVLGSVTEGVSQLQGAIWVFSANPFYDDQFCSVPLSHTVPVPSALTSASVTAPTAPTAPPNIPLFSNGATAAAQSPTSIFPDHSHGYPKTPSTIPQYKLPRYCYSCRAVKIWYTGSDSFPSVVSLDERYGASWWSGDRQYYNVQLQIIKAIDRLTFVQNISKADRCLRRSGFRMLLDEDNKTAIIKLMPGIPHEVAKVIFEEIFLGERARLGLPRSIYLILQVQEDIISQMSSTRKGPGHFPSYIVEIGVSQSLLQVRQDARHATSPLQKKTRSGSLAVPEKKVTGNPLILPIKLLFDVVPSHVPSSEISIGRQELMSYGIDLFDGLQ
ncbi:hypothetical protein V1520DRAFT_327205 [Lipomyces starkeyi]